MDHKYKLENDPALVVDTRIAGKQQYKAFHLILCIPALRQRVSWQLWQIQVGGKVQMQQEVAKFC